MNYHPILTWLFWLCVLCYFFLLLFFVFLKLIPNTTKRNTEKNSDKMYWFNGAIFIRLIRLIKWFIRFGWFFKCRNCFVSLFASGLNRPITKLFGDNMQYDNWKYVVRLCHKWSRCVWCAHMYVWTLPCIINILKR